MSVDRGQPEPPSWRQPDGIREYSSREREREREYRPARDVFPPPGGHAILGLNPPPGRRPGGRHRVRDGMLVGLGGLIVIVGIGTGLTGAKARPSSASRTATLTGGAEPSAAARSEAKGAVGSGSGRTLTYQVTGTPGAAVTYRPAGSMRTRQGPLHVTAALGTAPSYSVTAQLPGSGSVTCEILIGSAVISKSVAAGARNLASCEINRDPLSGTWHEADGG